MVRRNIMDAGKRDVRSTRDERLILTPERSLRGARMTAASARDRPVSPPDTQKRIVKSPPATSARPTAGAIAKGTLIASVKRPMPSPSLDLGTRSEASVPKAVVDVPNL